MLELPAYHMAMFDIDIIVNNRVLPSSPNRIETDVLTERPRASNGLRPQAISKRVAFTGDNEFEVLLKHTCWLPHPRMWTDGGEDELKHLVAVVTLVSANGDDCLTHHYDIPCVRPEGRGTGFGREETRFYLSFPNPFLCVGCGGDPVVSLSAVAGAQRSVSVSASCGCGEKGEGGSSFSSTTLVPESGLGDKDSGSGPDVGPDDDSDNDGDDDDDDDDDDNQSDGGVALPPLPPLPPPPPPIQTAGVGKVSITFYHTTRPGPPEKGSELVETWLIHFLGPQDYARIWDHALHGTTGRKLGGGSEVWRNRRWAETVAAAERAVDEMDVVVLGGRRW